MTFVLRKIISTLILPVSVCLLLLLCGILFLFTKKQRLARLLIVAGFLLFLLLSFPPFSGLLSHSLESKYSPFGNSVNLKVHLIVVLGGGHNSSRPEGLQLSSSSLARVVEGVRIFKLKPGMKLILSGGGVYDSIPNAVAMQTQAKILGVSEADITLESRSKDTEEEARLLAPLLKAEEFILVTSAIHMPRAIALFRQQRTHPIPAPTDYSFEAKNPTLLLKLLPNATSLQQSERALREYLGILWSNLRKKA